MTVNPERVDDIVRRLDELPTLPTVVGRLIELLDDPKAQARNIAELIASDASLAAKILKLVNSAYFGLPSKISSVQQAVVILGFSTIRSIVLGASVIKVFKQPGVHAGYFSPHAFWNHAVGTGAAAAAIAKIAELPKPEDAFTAGLLHGIGLLIIDQYLHDVMERVQELVEAEGISLNHAIEHELGFDHAVLAARLLSDWKLPEHIVIAVQHHPHVHTCPGDRRLAAAVHFGDLITRVLGYGSAGEPTFPAVSEEALKDLGFEPTMFPVLIEPIDRAIVNAAIFIDTEVID
ncbi:MAG: HDOD domain-containing protein [Planctomycetes bacterium]|nr:HDOD domain-containing protein [Planctomycetota bacterium]